MKISSAIYPRGSREAPSERLTLFPISRAKKDRKFLLLNRKPRLKVLAWKEP